MFNTVCHIFFFGDLVAQCTDLVVAARLLEFCTQQLHALGRYVIQSFNVCLLDQSKLFKVCHHKILIKNIVNHLLIKRIYRRYIFGKKKKNMCDFLSQHLSRLKYVELICWKRAKCKQTNYSRKVEIHHPSFILAHYHTHVYIRSEQGHHGWWWRVAR